MEVTKLKNAPLRVFSPCFVGVFPKRSRRTRFRKDWGVTEDNAMAVMMQALTSVGTPEASASSQVDMAMAGLICCHTPGTKAPPNPNTPRERDVVMLEPSVKFYLDNKNKKATKIPPLGV